MPETRISRRIRFVFHEIMWIVPPLSPQRPEDVSEISSEELVSEIWAKLIRSITIAGPNDALERGNFPDPSDSTIVAHRHDVCVSSTFLVVGLLMRNFQVWMMDCKSLISYTVNPHFLDDHICALLSHSDPVLRFVLQRQRFVHRSHGRKRPQPLTAGAS